MADYFDCTNNGIDLTAFLPNLITEYPQMFGDPLSGIRTYTIPSGRDIVATPYVCTENDTYESLMKRCIELDCCGKPALRLFRIDASNCPDDYWHCSDNITMERTIKSVFWNILGKGLAIVQIDTYTMCTNV